MNLIEFYYFIYYFMSKLVSLLKKLETLKNISYFPVTKYV